MKGNRGFTLVEMLCCLAFFSVAVFPILGCLRDGQNRAQLAMLRRRAFAKVQNGIENERVLAYTNALTAGSAMGSGTFTGTNISYTTNVTATLVSGYADLYQVTSSCSWSNAALDNFGKTGTLTITTYMRNNHV